MPEWYFDAFQNATHPDFRNKKLPLRLNIN